MTKIVYNAAYGGFRVPEEYRKYKNFPASSYLDEDSIKVRTDPLLIELVERPDYKGDLAIRELKEGTVYRIDEYDGYEEVLTFDDHRWYIA